MTRDDASCSMRGGPSKQRNAHYPCNATVEDIAKLASGGEESIQLFHKALSSDPFVESLLNMAQVFQSSIVLEQTPLRSFSWEDDSLEELRRMSLQDLIPRMVLFPVVTDNEWKSDETWPKPGGWPEAWPANPTKLLSAQTSCSLCTDTACRCIHSRMAASPHVTAEGPLGQGVRAYGEPGKIVYQNGQLLGELVGQLVPLDTHHDGWAMEFVRPDLNDAPVAQIYTRHVGN